MISENKRDQGSESGKEGVPAKDGLQSCSVTSALPMCTSSRAPEACIADERDFWLPPPLVKDVNCHVSLWECSLGSCRCPMLPGYQKSPKAGIQGAQWRLRWGAIREHRTPAPSLCGARRRGANRMGSDTQERSHSGSLRHSAIVNTTQVSTDTDREFSVCR